MKYKKSRIRENHWENIFGNVGWKYWRPEIGMQKWRWWEWDGPRHSLSMNKLDFLKDWKWTWGESRSRMDLRLVKVAERWQQFKCPSMDEWTNSGIYMWWNIIYTLKEWNTETLYNVDEPPNIMLNERKQIPEFTYCMVTFIWNIQNKKISKDRKHIDSFQEL